MLDYPGEKPPAIHVLHNYDEVYKGSLSFTSAMNEYSIREEIAQLVQEKTSNLYDFTSIEATDFEFVKCVNRHVRVPDGRACFMVYIDPLTFICKVDEILFQICMLSSSKQTLKLLK